jgi:hypothetical protein
MFNDFDDDDCVDGNSDVTYTTTQRLIQTAPTIRMMMQYGPKVGLDLSFADVPTVLVVMFCLMWNGANDAPDIYNALSGMSCKLDRESIDFLLDQYDGDDPKRHLWESFNGAKFMPKFDLLHEGRRLAA